MGLVAEDAGHVLPIAPPISGHLSMNSRAPLRQLLAMTLGAELPGVFEGNQGCVGQTEVVRVHGVVAVSAPEVSVRELRIFVFEFEFARDGPLISCHIVMAVVAGQIVIGDFGSGR